VKSLSVDGETRREQPPGKKKIKLDESKGKNTPWGVKPVLDEKKKK